MNHQLLLGIGSALVFGLCVGVTGCARPPALAPAEPVSVPVSHPVEQYVTDYADFTAQIAAIDSVQVKAHVWGYLKKVNFQEGGLVKKDDILFELDPRPYEALLDQAKAKVAQERAQLAFHEADYKRYQELAPIGGVSKSEVDRIKAARDEDIANIAADEAVVAQRQLDLEYTKVTAPVGGRVSRYYVTVGNLIEAGNQGGGTLLTTIVSVDPMYAYFEIDELTVQRVNRLVRAGKLKSTHLKSTDEARVPVSLGLSTEEGFPHRGTVNFVDNQLNPKTGTLRVRGVFPNEDGALSPGFFARVRLPVSPNHPALLVSERALDNDQGQRILYLVNAKNEVVSRPVRLGGLHDGLREVTDGLKPGERVVVNGLQQIRPGMTVEPKLVTMPAPAVQNPNETALAARTNP
jgi:RND family efflux transporter MFP subunit